MAFSIVTIGTGTCVPRLERGSSALLVEAGEVRILIDCGLGATHGLLRAGLRPVDLDAIVLTHFHPDHTAELAAMLFSMKYPLETARSRRLPVFGGPGLGRFFMGLQLAWHDWLDAAGYLGVIESGVGDSVVLSGDCRLAFGPAAHRPESLSVRVAHGGQSLVVTGDTDVCPELAAFSTGADLLVAEAAMPDGRKLAGHLTPSLAGKMAAESGVSRLVLTHFYPESDAVDATGMAEAVFSGPVIPAEDGMRIDL